MISGAFSILEAVAKFRAFSLDMELVGEIILSEWAGLVQKRATEAIGTYRYGWPALGPAAVAKHGDTPLLDTGALRDSISAFVQMHGPGHGRAVVGSNSDIAVYQELGTSRIPPRSFLMSSAMRSHKDIGIIARRAIHTAWTGAGVNGSAIREFLHAARLGLHIAHDIIRAGKYLTTP
jgi:hypothetical protein